MIHKSFRRSAPEIRRDRPEAKSPLGEAFDVSIDTVPDEWVEAEAASPIPYDEYTSISQPGRVDTVPTGNREGVFVANVAAFIAAMLAGGLWYAVDVLDVYSGPWPAILVAAIIGLAVQRTSKVMSAYGSVVSVAFYLLTLVAVLFALTHRDLVLVYGEVTDLSLYEDTLVRTRLRKPLHIVAYVLGIGVAAQMSFLQRLRN